jgi:enamine deaminase RidA (YjgF/YER057c/UK114 family)
MPRRRTASGGKDEIQARLDQLGLVLPSKWQLPSGVVSSASFTRLQGKRMIVSGHLPLAQDGTVCGPYGKVGDQVSLMEAVVAARLCGLAILSSLKAALVSLDAIASWTMVRGYINCGSFNEFPKVMNGCSDLLVAVFGPDRGSHARLAIGVAGLPFDAPVEIEAELTLR